MNSTDTRPALEPERRAPARPVETQQVRAERELGAPIAVQGFKGRINTGDSLTQPVFESGPGRRISRHLPLWIGLAFVGFTLGAQLAVRWQIPFPRCMLRKFTGIPCPTCGCTRSLLAWSNLDLAAAFRFNPLFFVLCLGLLAWFGLWCVERLTGRAWLERWGGQVRRGRVWKLFIALAVVNWLYLWLRLPR